MLDDRVARDGPIVSVVIPTYDRGRFIADCISSVLNQTYTDFEIVVVDDGSADRTAALIEAFGSDKINYIRQDHRGRSAARNRALRSARGRYITFLDSDDLYLPNKLELQVSYLDSHPEMGMVYTSALCIDEFGNTLADRYDAPVSGWIYPHVAFYLPVTITLPTVMMRREVLQATGGFDESMERFEDTDMWRRISKRYQIGAIAEPTCKLRSHAGNVIDSQHPPDIVSAIDYYVKKISREDQDVEPLVREAGAHRLYNHYGRGLATHEPFRSWSDAALEKSTAFFHPTVSIIIPVYNGANFLREAIDSALAQTYSNLEILVINDGSDDNGETERIALSYGDRIRYFSKPNGGGNTALNLGIAEMRGEYFSWLSHDDLYYPDKIERQIAFLKTTAEPHRTILYSDYSVFSDDATHASPIRLPHFEPDDFQYFLTICNALHGCTLLLPKAAFDRHGTFPERIRTTYDYDLWFRIADDFRFVHLPDLGVKARSHSNQGTITMGDVVLTECNELLAGFVERLPPAEIQRHHPGPLTVGYLCLAANLRRRGFNAAGDHAARLARSKFGNADNDEMFRALERSILELDNATSKTAEVEIQLEQARKRVARSAELEAQLDEQRKHSARLAAELEIQLGENRKHAAKLTELEIQLEDQRKHTTGLAAALGLIYSSSSWRITAPLRAVRRASMQFGSFFRRR